MKILISAYACEPGKGSEPEVGLQAVLSAATHHDVWVLTRENNLEALVPFLREQGLTDRVHVTALEVPGLALRSKKRGIAFLHWYYDEWQRRAGEIARDLDRTVDFDVVHHATFATYWTRAGVATVGKPFVWGPVGGGVEVPLRLVGTLGLRGLAEEVVRAGARRSLAWLPYNRENQRNATVVLTQNSQTRARLRHCVSSDVTVLPNAASVDVEPPVDLLPRTQEIVMASRLVPWKGGALAIAVMREVRHAKATLQIFGNGPDRTRLQRLADRWGVRDRVRFIPAIARSELVSRVARAGVLLHPSLHEEAGFAVAEALSLGTPVVCLDWGGPSALAAEWPDSPKKLIRPEGPQRTAVDLAAAVDAFLEHPPPVPREAVPPRQNLRTTLLDAYTRATSGGHTR